MVSFRSAGKRLLPPLAAAAFALVVATRDRPPPSHDPPLRASAARLPLTFERNQGQWDSAVFFEARAGIARWVFTSTEAVLVARDSVFRMRFSERPVEPQGGGQLTGVANYFLGSDRAAWRTDVPTFGKIRYPEVWPGVDLVFHGAGSRLEYDFVVAPGADESSIHLAFDDAEGIVIDSNGDLIVRNRGRSVVHRRPTAFQEDASGARIETQVAYAMLTTSEVALRVSTHDQSRILVVDPVLDYVTYLGGNFDETGFGTAIDSSGNLYVTGTTLSSNFPVVDGGIQTTFGGIGILSYGDAFVSKLNSTGGAVVYSTYLGGSGDDYGVAIALDGARDAYVAGVTDSTNFPVVNALQGALAGTLGKSDAFVARLDNLGSTLVFSTYLGGKDVEVAKAIAVDGSGSAYVVGSTLSSNFPTSNAFQKSLAGGQDAFVTKLTWNAPTLALAYSTYLGGTTDETAFGVAVNAGGEAHVAGWTDSTNFPTLNALAGLTLGGGDAFITEFSASGSLLVFSTLLGGTGADYAYGVAVDTAGDVYVAGQTGSSDFPISLNAPQSAYGGGSDAFVTKLAHSSGSSPTLAYSTFLGGTLLDTGNAIALDTAGNAYVVGSTASADFPLAGAFQPKFAGGTYDVFITKVNPAGTTFVWSSYLGGSGDDEAFAVAVDDGGVASVSGQTASTDFPVTAGAFQTAFQGGSLDAFVARIEPLGGSASDGGLVPDAGPPAGDGGTSDGATFDAGSLLDAGSGSDAANLDAGVGPDAGVTLDAGSGQDAGVSADSGATSDAANPGDAGPQNDAGGMPTSDGGLAGDAASGVGPLGADVGCGCTQNGATGPLAWVVMALAIVTPRRRSARVVRVKSIPWGPRRQPN